MPGNRKSPPLIDLPWQKQNLASISAALTILIVVSLCKGLLSQNSDYKLTAPASVSVQQGLCVHIPCNFTYVAEDRFPPREKLYGFWFQEDPHHVHYFVTKYSYYAISGILVATNEKSGTLLESVDKRFNLTGDLEAGNCSFSILKARPRDTGRYFFRIEGGMMKFSYGGDPTKHRKIDVLVREKPQIRTSSAVFPGKEVALNCSTLGPCNGEKPEISWATNLTGYGTSQWNQRHSNGSWTYGSDFIFTPSRSDHGKSLTCRVRYTDTWEPAANTLVLDFDNQTDGAPLSNGTRLRLLGRIWVSPIPFFVIIVSLIKVSFCCFFFFSIFGLLYQRRTPQEASTNC